MSSSSVGDRVPREMLQAPGPRARREPVKSLALARLQRAIVRQLPLFAVATAAVTVIGALYDVSGGVRWQTAAVFWLPLSAGAAFVVALVRELGRNTITSITSFGKNRAYAVLGAAPELTESALRQLPPDQRSPLGCLAFQPASAFATAFRDLQDTLARERLIAFIGSTPDEGATTAALCTAVAATQQGRSVIIIDCDLRRRTLSRGFGLDPEAGVLEATEHPDSWRHYVEQEDETGLHVLPAARMRSPWRTLIGARGLPILLQRLSQEYDLVVLDCPPALGPSEGALIASLASKTVVVTAWDRTPLRAVRTALRMLQRRERSPAAVWVNRVPPGYRFGRLRGA